ncbi:OLC1v1019082C1 [Oldenlandia corymbosa var. corymbosa]|uniref:OLC1v1019082C1 n=1 Tax=Oldenlandia corymbosa var. corymbosa TaxID=529605 RepID=A0AAV1ED77_OLDCO|nr:OLC1v1019082C1 [Oldenlandia corymbosa var. corymbosa]
MAEVISPASVGAVLNSSVLSLSPGSSMTPSWDPPFSNCSAAPFSPAPQKGQNLVDSILDILSSPAPALGSKTAGKDNGPAAAVEQPKGDVTDQSAASSASGSNVENKDQKKKYRLHAEPEAYLSRVSIRRSAMYKSLVRIGPAEAIGFARKISAKSDRVKRGIQRRLLTIKQRRENFKLQRSRLSMMIMSKGK